MRDSATVFSRACKLKEYIHPRHYAHHGGTMRRLNPDRRAFMKLAALGVSATVVPYPPAAAEYVKNRSSR